VLHLTSADLTVSSFQQLPTSFTSSLSILSITGDGDVRFGSVRFGFGFGVRVRFGSAARCPGSVRFPPRGVRVRFGSHRAVSGFGSVPRSGVRNRFGAGFGSECTTEPGACRWLTLVRGPIARMRSLGDDRRGRPRRRRRGSRAQGAHKASQARTWVCRAYVQGMPASGDFE
jgi:hypothetical protein